jgi:chromosome segregation ATPase
VADVQARFMAETMSRDKLWNEAADLRRSLKELGAQLAERETEHRDLTRKLEEERAAAAQLRADVASAAERSRQVLAELKAREQRVNELELLVLARDETIAGLQRRLRSRERAEDELLAQKNDLEAQTEALALEVRLAAEAGAKTERDSRDAQQKVVRFEALLREAGQQIDDLFTAIEEKENQILSLEADLRARQDAVGVLQRSARLFDDGYVDLDCRRATVDSPPRRH